MADTACFTAGCGVALGTAAQEWPAVRLSTVTAVTGDVLYLDRRRCLIERCSEVEIHFRQEPNENRTPDRSLVESCRLRDNRAVDIVYQRNREE